MIEGGNAVADEATRSRSASAASSRATVAPLLTTVGTARPPRRVDLVIVEDNSDDLELALLVLGQLDLGGRVQVARDGAEALSALLPAPDGDAPEGARPRLILLDLKLPRFSGIEVLRRIREHPATRTVPVVVMTSSAQDADIAACIELGANSYVVKPVDFEGFADAIRQIGRYWLQLNTSAEAVRP